MFVTLWMILMVLVILYYMKSWFSSAKLPPGPTPYPLIGNLLLFLQGKKDVEVFRDLADRYGAIVHLKIGPFLTMVVLNDAKLVREAFSRIEFASRPQLYISKLIFEERGIIMQSKEETWKQLRRLMMQSMKNFGVGKKRLEERITAEAYCFVSEVEKCAVDAKLWRLMVHKAVSNIVCSVVFGDRFDYNDPSYVFILSRVIHLAEVLSVQAPETFVPALKHIRPGAKKVIQTIKSVNHDLGLFVRSQVKNHRDTYDENNIRDFIDIYIQSCQGKVCDGSNIQEEEIFRAIIDMFLAGTETTSTTILWLILYLLHHPHIQARLRQNIKQELGNRTPLMSDREKLPYLEAIILETLRLSTVASVGVAHCTTKDVKFQGYDIPQGALVFANLIYINTSTTYWEDGDKFIPERWLDEHGHLKKHDHSLPFSTGKRACVGETLAFTELFLFITILIQTFELSPRDPLPTMKPAATGATSAPQEYNFKVTRVT